MIPYGTQDITAEDIEAVTETLKSPYLTQGPQVPAFEAAIAKYCGATSATCTNSATSALHIACLALGLGQGGILWTSPNSFVASANCGIYCGAKIDFVDIEPIHLNICPTKLEHKLEKAKQENKLPQVLVVVHFAGQPCDMEQIHKLAQAYKFKVIEDASHALGSSFKELRTGSCKYSDITVFSFHPVKMITSAEGGCALTNDPDLEQQMKLLRSHGITREPSLLKNTDEGPWYYEQQTLGFNYRMTDINAALGLSQLNRLEQYIEKRHALADIYDEKLHALPLKLPTRNKNTYSSLHLYTVQIDPQHTNISRRELYQRMLQHGIGVNVHYYPIHLQPFYKQLGFQLGDYPAAEEYYAHALTIPLHPKLSTSDQKKICSCLTEALGE